MTDEELYPNRHLMGERKPFSDEPIELPKVAPEPVQTPSWKAAGWQDGGYLTEPPEFFRARQRTDEEELAVFLSEVRRAREAELEGIQRTPTPGSDKWLAVDLDGTLAQGIWTPENPTDEIGDPILHGINQCTRYDLAGWKIVIHTSRPWYHYAMIEEWLFMHAVPVRAIVCGKLFAHRYIDDRAVNAAEKDWV